MCILQTRQLKPIEVKQGAQRRTAEEDLTLICLVQSPGALSESLGDHHPQDTSDAAWVTDDV